MKVGRARFFVLCNQMVSFQGKHVVVYFIIAAPKYGYDMRKLMAEQEQYNDLIVTDVDESYENLVLKAGVDNPAT